jgi:hypothetical protein
MMYHPRFKNRVILSTCLLSTVYLISTYSYSSTPCFYTDILTEGFPISGFYDLIQQRLSLGSRLSLSPPKYDEFLRFSIKSTVFSGRRRNFYDSVKNSIVFILPFWFIVAAICSPHAPCWFRLLKKQKSSESFPDLFAKRNFTCYSS